MSFFLRPQPRRFSKTPFFNRREWSTFRPALTAAQLLFAHAGPGSGRGVDDGLKARRASPLGKGSGLVAELVCQSCGMVSHSPLPRFRADTMPACLCGGRRQVVRVKHHLQAGERSGR